jgi:hypothetical protein
METPVFIHYTDPSQKGVDRETRRVIASHAAKSRKTKVAARLDSLARPLVDRSVNTATARRQNRSIQNHKSCPEEQGLDAAPFVIRDDRTHACQLPRTRFDCLRDEPFDAYPIKARIGISEAIDYCKPRNYQKLTSSRLPAKRLLKTYVG